MNPQELVRQPGSLSGAHDQNAPQYAYKQHFGPVGTTVIIAAISFTSVTKDYASTVDPKNKRVTQKVAQRANP